MASSVGGVLKTAEGRHGRLRGALRAEPQNLVEDGGVGMARLRAALEPG